MANKTSFKTGQSGNPKGRPPKSRALTDILAKAGSVKVTSLDGKPLDRKNALAEMIWTAAIAGQVHFRAANREVSAKYGSRPMDRDLELDWGQWWPLAVWLYHQIDGDLAVTFQEKAGGDGDELPTGGGDEPPVLYMPDNGRENPQQNGDETEAETPDTNTQTEATEGTEPSEDSTD
ncbi:hypothetical protein EON83_00120 [bacterium]|nr:MAG: hypothetical protein EON83_00120 [bacterium]